MNLPVNYNEMTQSERRLVRLEYIKQQDNKCYHCKCSLTADPPTLSKPVTKHLFPKNFFDHPVHLHHNHDTGMTIGAVHAHCNAVLWEYHGE